MSVMRRVPAGVRMDARWAGMHGIGRYATELRNRLRFASEVSIDKGVKPASLLDPLWLAVELRQGRSSGFFSPGYNAAFGSPVRQLLVVHDLIHLDVASESSMAKKAYYSCVVRPAVRKNGLVVTVSEFSKQRIAEWSGLSAEAIVVAPGGLSSAFTDASPCDRLLLDEYVLFVGSSKPHKNLSLAMRVARALDGLKTVFVGDFDGADTARIRALGDRAVSMRGLDDTTLRSLYAHASALLFPSSYEGFGLPAIEAMSQGTPVVSSCTAVSALTEGCGIHVDPASHPQVYTEAIYELARCRSSLRSRCVQAALAFSWESTACAVGDALEASFG